jgi:predicted ArsR family transcriptional regulator
VARSVDGDRATELDGPGAIVSHAEVLAEYAAGRTRPADVADALGVSASTVRRLLRNLRAAGLLPVAG